MADGEKIIGMTRSELIELIRQILAEMPTELPANGGNSDTVNGHTVNSDVPENAKFTDTVYDLTQYAKITDIPSIKVNSAANADTVGGKLSSDFLPFQLYAPIYTGDIKNISNMGTYSCYKGDCTNLPDISMWAYVTMVNFRDAGYKTFLCVELNPPTASQYSKNIYIAREGDIDSNGNMNWYRACDGGVSETISNWGNQTILDANDAPYGFSNVSPDSINTPNAFWTTILTVGTLANTSYKQQIALPWDATATIKYRAKTDNVWGSWVSIADGGNAATVAGRNPGRISTLDASGNYWDKTAPNINDLYIQWDALKQYFKLKTYGGNDVAVDIATSSYVVGTFSISANQTKTISLGFTPSYVDIRGNDTGYRINVSAKIITNGFTAEGYTELTNNAVVRYIAFR